MDHGIGKWKLRFPSLFVREMKIAFVKRYRAVVATSHKQYCHPLSGVRSDRKYCHPEFGAQITSLGGLVVAAERV